MFPVMKLSVFAILSNSLAPQKYADVNGPGALNTFELKLVYISIALFSAAYNETMIVFYAFCPYVYVLFK
jgi:hypothetical protein